MSSLVLKLGILSLLWIDTEGQTPDTKILQVTWQRLYRVPDKEVNCDFMKNCVLPCRLESNSYSYVQWTHKESNSVVHVSDNGQDVLDKQGLSYRGRTFMLHDWISVGDASLLLSSVTVQDEGTYICQGIRSGDREVEEKRISLKVKGPEYNVTLERRQNKLICRSERIFLFPTFHWTPAIEDHLEIQKTDNQLYSAVSTIIIDPQIVQQYTCNVSTDRSSNTATYSVNDVSDPNPAVVITIVVMALVLASVIIVVIVWVGPRKLRKLPVRLILLTALLMFMFSPRMQEQTLHEPEENMGPDETIDLLRMLKLIFRDLSENELQMIRSFLTDHSLMEGFSIIPSDELEKDKDISETLIRVYGADSIRVTEKLLQKLQRRDLLEKLSERNNDPEEISGNAVRSKRSESFTFVSEVNGSCEITESDLFKPCRLVDAQPHQAEQCRAWSEAGWKQEQELMLVESQSQQC